MGIFIEIMKIVLPTIVGGIFTFLITKYTYNKNVPLDKLEFVERFLELSLFYGLSSPLNSEMICIFPYF